MKAWPAALPWCLSLAAHATLLAAGTGWLPIRALVQPELPPALEVWLQPARRVQAVQRAEAVPSARRVPVGRAWEAPAHALRPPGADRATSASAESRVIVAAPTSPALAPVFPEVAGEGPALPRAANEVPAGPAEAAPANPVVPAAAAAPAVSVALAAPVASAATGAPASPAAAPARAVPGNVAAAAAPAPLALATASAPAAAYPPESGPAAREGDSGPLLPASTLVAPLPTYPAHARLAGVQGTVRMRARIDPDGAAGRVQLLRSSGNDELDQAALESVRHWQFRPARRGGQDVPSWLDIPVRFALEDDAGGRR